MPPAYTDLQKSPGSARHLGRISKRGDRSLRMLLTHGARSELRAVRRPEKKLTRAAYA